MELAGTWKPYGQFKNEDQRITIQDEKLTFWNMRAGQNSKQITVPFHLVEAHSLRENNCYDIVMDEENFKYKDFMVHEEIIEGKSVVILSDMGMEYDGRGRIVIASYVREEDYALINDEFKSVAYQYWNNRPSVPMMQMNPNGGNVFMGPDMISGRMPCMNPGMNPEKMAMASGTVSQADPWDCICGKKGITSKFCPECGMPTPKQM